VQSPASDVTASSLQRIGAIARCERVTRSRWSAEQYSRVVGVAAAPIPILEPASQSRGERPPSHACWYVFAEGIYTEHSGGVQRRSRMLVLDGRPRPGSALDGL
jgi:hypothetical protein